MEAKRRIKRITDMSYMYDCATLGTEELCYMTCRMVCSRGKRKH